MVALRARAWYAPTLVLAQRWHGNAGYLLDHVSRRGAARPRSKLERVPRMHNNRAVLRSSNLGVLLVDPSLLVSCGGPLPVRPTPWERAALRKPPQVPTTPSNATGRPPVGACIARGVRSGLGESEFASSIMSESGCIDADARVSTFRCGRLDKVRFTLLSSVVKGAAATPYGFTLG